MRDLSKKKVIEYIAIQLDQCHEQLATCGVSIEVTENLRGQIIAYRAMMVAVEKISKADNPAAH